MINIQNWKNQVQTIYQNIKTSKNQKIIEQTIPHQEYILDVIDQNIQSLFEADLKTQQYIAVKIMGLLEFSSKPEQLQNPGMFSFTRKSQLESQNRFIYYLNDLPNLLIQSAQQFSTTMSVMFKEKIVEADPHQLLELNFIIPTNDEQYGTSFVAIMKKLGDSQLYNHSISTSKIENKINSQQSLFNLPSKIELLQLQIDHKMLELCVQLKNMEVMGYSIENKDAQNMQKIYLTKGMIIKLSNNLSIEVKECQFQTVQKIQDNFITIIEQELLIYKPRLKNDKLKNFIVLEINYDGEKEAAEIYLSSESLDLGTVFFLPETIKVNLHIDSSGYYCTQDSDNKEFYPHILYDKPLRTSNQQRLSLAVVVNGKTKVFVSSNLKKVWNHEDLFEI